MGLFKTLLKRETPTQPTVSLLSKADFPSVFFDGYTTLSNHPEFIAGIDKLADLISNMTIHLIEKDKNGNESRVRDQLARKLDVHPNNYMTRKTFIANIVRNLMLYGNQVTVPVYKRELLDDLIPLPQIEVHFDRAKRGYVIRHMDKEIDPMNVCHFVLNPNPSFPYKGQGYRIILRDVLANLNQANKTKQNYMSLKHQPSVVVSVQTDGSADAEKWKESKDNMIRDYLTTTNAGEPWVIPDSMMDVKSIAPLTLQDIAINESVEIDKKTVAAVLGIPAFLLGVGEFDRDEYNNFIETKVKSIATIIQQEMTRKLIYSENRFIRFNHHSLLDYSLVEWAEIGVKVVSIGAMTKQELRNKIGLEHVDNPELDEFTVLENYIPIEDVGNQKKLDKEGGD